MVTTQGQQSAIDDAVALTTAGQQAAITTAVALATQNVTIAAQNVYLLSPPEVKFDKVTKQFLDKKLPCCIDKPSYQHYIEVRNCLYHNLRQITSPFGGGQHGHLGMIMATAKYLNISGSAWKVPPSQTAVPVIPAGATPDKQSTIFNQWVITEKGIMYADHVTRHARNLITTAWPE